MDFCIQLTQQLLFSCHSLVSNWGFAIVAVTAIIRFALFPLQIITTVQQRKLKNHQPEFDLIAEKYKGDLAGSLAAAAALRARAGIKPWLTLAATVAQGFLFFVMYNALTGFSVLQSGSFAWIANLAAPDPIYVLPLAAALVSWMQLRTSEPTPRTGSQKIPSWIFPTISFVVTANLGSGIALYYFTSGAIQAAAQYAVNKWI